jgi:hypothetical protein
MNKIYYLEMVISVTDIRVLFELFGIRGYERISSPDRTKVTEIK